MSRPKNKIELINQSQQNYQKLKNQINNLSLEQKEKEFPENYLNRNIRDVIAHLHHWHLMFLDWYKVGMSGEKPNMPAKGYTWKTTPDLNKEIRKMYLRKTLEEVLEFIESSYNDLQKIINEHTDEELFEKKRYKWTGSTSLGAYLVSATSSHYEWAFKLIKKCLK